MPQRIHIQIHKSKQQSNIEVTKASTTPPTILNHNLGLKNYELSNHLGNVTTVISDRKMPRSILGTIIDFYMPDIVSATDYYPFGMTMQERTFSAGVEAYRFGFNGKENDNEISVDGGNLDFGARIYDSRLGRWMSVDPEVSKYPMNSPYNSFNNSPIFVVDKNGQGGEGVIEGNEFVIYMHVVFFGEIVNQNPNLAAIVTDKVNQQLNAACTQVMIGDQNYNVRFVVTYEVKKTPDAIDLACKNVSEKYNPKLNFINIVDNDKLPNSNTTASQLDAYNHSDRANTFSGYFAGDNSARIKLSSVNNPKSTSEAHEIIHWLTRRDAKAHDESALTFDEIPHIMRTGRSDVTNANPIYTEQLPLLAYRTLNYDCRMVIQKNITDMGLYLQKSGNYQVGGATNNLYDDNGKEFDPCEN